MQEYGTFSNAITGLPGLAWRNLDPPAYSTANFSGAPSLARRAYPYVEGISHEHTGADAIVTKVCDSGHLLHDKRGVYVPQREMWRFTHSGTSEGQSQGGG